MIANDFELLCYDSGLQWYEKLARLYVCMLFPSNQIPSFQFLPISFLQNVFEFLENLNSCLQSSINPNKICFFSPILTDPPPSQYRYIWLHLSVPSVVCLLLTNLSTMEDTCPWCSWTAFEEEDLPLSWRASSLCLVVCCFLKSGPEMMQLPSFWKDLSCIPMSFPTGGMWGAPSPASKLY